VWIDDPWFALWPRAFTPGDRSAGLCLFADRLVLPGRFGFLNRTVPWRGERSLTKEIVLMATMACLVGVPASHLQASFLKVLPRIEQQARFAFRNYHCAADREDAVQETIAVAWAWYVRLAQRGKNPTDFVSTLACFAAIHVRCGRRLCGTEATQDALSPTARYRMGFCVQQLGQPKQLHTAVWEEALHDNTRSAPDQAAMFRIDFPKWLGTLGDRNRQIVADLLLGERTSAVAGKHALSPGRVAQLRREFHRGWQEFQGERLPVADARALAVETAPA
jgi:DNA-directed RNA polymerase specialized sigma24 family protein